MKFAQLKTGDRFIWNDEFYVKNSPLIANHLETGASKIVPKYVNIQLPDKVRESSKSLNKPDEMLHYLVNELQDAINLSSLSDASKELMFDELARVKRAAEEKLSKV